MQVMCVKFFFTSDARVEDSGNYTCGISNQNEADFMKLEVNVLRDISSIVLSVDDEQINGGGADVLHEDLEQPVRKKFTCQVTGSNPAPTVKLYRGNGAAEDVTDLLEDSTLTEQIQRQIIDGKEALQAVHITKVLEGNFLVDSHSSRLPLYCSANVHDLAAKESHKVTYQFQGCTSVS